MARNLDFYEERRFQQVLATYVAEFEQSHGKALGGRTAFLLGGQSGAGKTTLQEILKKYFKRDYVIINGDEYRSSHPHFAELQEAYGKEAVSHTAQWAGRMTEALIDALSKQGYNLIIEGTLRTAEVPRKTATLLKSRGYEVSLALMAVKPEISLISCQIRYEMMKAAGTTPRATDPAHHNKIVQDIVNNLAELEQDDLFSGVYLYNRSEECLYPTKNPSDKASEVLRNVLFGPWTAAEKKHLAFLQKQLALYQPKA